MAKVGAFVLETLTTGMYVEPLDTVREFIQNSTDSIRRAEACGLLRPGEGRIQVVLDLKGRSMCIRDNGEGVPAHEVSHRLINVGMSAKRIGCDAGFRGIGRLAAVAYCGTLVFETSYAGEARVSKVSWDCSSIRRAISPSLRGVEELTEVLDRNTSIETRESEPGSHYFEVRLEDIDQGVASRFLSWQEVERYLSQVAPVPFDAQRFIFAPKITEWAARKGISIPSVTVTIKEPGRLERQVFKPYKGRYHTARENYDVEIRDVGFFPEDAGPGSPFWLWYGKSELLGMIAERDAAGLRFRRHNIGLGGPERVAELFREIAGSNERFNAYYIGEVHVLSEGAIPNARRDGFENNDEWLSIRGLLIPFLRERSNDIRAASQVRNRPVAKIARSVAALAEEAKQALRTGFISPAEKADLVGRLGKEIEKVDAALCARRDEKELKQLGSSKASLERVKQEVERARELVTTKLSPSLDRKQRKIIQDILELLRQVLEDESYAIAKDAIVSKYGLKED